MRKPPAAIAKYVRSYYAEIEANYDPEDNSRRSYEVGIGEMRKRLEAFRCEQIGPHKLYLGDCRELLPLLGTVDAVVTDPPYGIGADLGAGKSADKWAERTGDNRWDSAAPSADLMAEVLAKGRYAIVWGGNYFGLPATKCWLVWDKQTAGITTFADCEVAWTNLPKAMRLVRHLWSGPYMKVREERHHPTQKPLDVMRWAIDHLPKECRTILDPFMGSGTTGVACAKMDRRFVGVELDPGYFETACARIKEAMSQPDMFVTTPEPAPEQLALLEAP
jgi:DNA modification methylase